MPENLPGKHMPDVDVAAAGGWKETTGTKRAYQ